MASPSQAEKTAINKPPPTRSLFGRVLDLVILVSNVCGKSPLPFQAAALLALGTSYLIRALGEPSFPRQIITGFGVLIGYYFLVGSYRLFIYNRVLDPLLAIPGPKGHWLRGVYDTIVTSETAVSQQIWIKQYSNPTGMIAYSLLGQRCIAPYSPSALSIFLNSPNYIKPPRTTHFVKFMIGDGLVNAEYEVHKRQRRILTPAFGVSHIRAITPHFWYKATQLAQHLSVEVDEQRKEGIDVMRWMNRVTLDIIGLAGFGMDFESVKSENQPLATAYHHLFEPGPTTRLTVLFWYLIPGFKYLPIPANKALQNARSTIQNAALGMIRAKQAQETDNEDQRSRDILGVMIEENRKNREAGMMNDVLSEDEMVNQIMTFLAAGHETTASSVTWALYLLAKYPEIQTRLRKEVRTLDINHSPSFEQVESLRYLNNICREVVRFIPPVAMTVRHADKDDIVNGIKVPAGTSIFIAPGVTNFDPDSWGPDVASFNPDRWDKLPETISNYSFLTFLQGTRSCIGRKFAETEMKCLLAVLIGKFTFEEVDPMRIVEKESIITVRPKGGMPLHVRKVTSA